mmetsp:Transcript_19554/g.59142  ORF Transcript_19554/g.59142 Transcript_19554/m.59142 type:complete len:125 (+) Transcript_19554:540-914(+)
MAQLKFVCGQPRITATIIPPHKAIGKFSPAGNTGFPSAAGRRVIQHKPRILLPPPAPLLVLLVLATFQWSPSLNVMFNAASDLIAACDRANDVVCHSVAAAFAGWTVAARVAHNAYAEAALRAT